MSDDGFEQITWEYIREEIKQGFQRMSELLNELVASLMCQGWSEHQAREIVIFSLRGGGPR